MEIIKDNFLNEEVKKFSVNGLKVYVLEKKQFLNISASFVVNYGSNDISFKNSGEDDFKNYPLGIAHFLEHKMFDGNGEDEIFKKFSQIGADVNAYTSNNVTNYYFNTINNFKTSLLNLCDMIYGLNLTNESVENEKYIIEQEIKMYNDDPNDRVYKNFLKTMYPNHPLENDIAGDVSSIKNITKEHLFDCYNSFYVNNNMFLVIVGNVDATEVKSYLETSIRQKFNNVIRKKFNGFSNVRSNYIEENMDMSISTNIFGFKDIKNDNSIKRMIIFDLIQKMYFKISSKFYEDIYKESIIDGSYKTEYVNEIGYSYFAFSCDGDKFKNFPERFFNYYRKHDFSNDVFVLERAKKEIYGNYITLFNNVNSVLFLMVNFIKNDLNLFSYLDELNKITLDDISFEFENFFLESESNSVYSRII